MKPYNGILKILIVGVFLPFVSCKKFLDAKSDKSLVILSKFSELQGLLDQGIMYGNYPYGGAISDDNFYYTYSNFSTLNDINSKSYTWDGNAQFEDNWRDVYRVVSNANIVLNAVDNLQDSSSSQQARDNVKGSALYYRAYSFYELSQMFAPRYTTITASSLYGIPLKTSPNVEDAITRSTIQQTYDFIIDDLKKAAELLPEKQSISVYKGRPSRSSCFGQLARTYLSMEKYDSAFRYADLCLNLYNTLLDYNNSNDVSPSSSNPFKRFNDEVIFHAVSKSNSAFSKQMVDSVLYLSYGTNDLRRTTFYKPNAPGFTFKGNYNASTSSLFTGIATDEIYLIRSECFARLGNKEAALNDLNTLLVKRWKTGTFASLTPTNNPDALTVILNERRKELAFRGTLRWSDLRRLNSDPIYRKNIVRVIEDKTYTLFPADDRYTFLIPQTVLDIHNLMQNPR